MNHRAACLLAIILLIAPTINAAQEPPSRQLAEAEAALVQAPDHAGYLLQAAAALVRTGDKPRALELLGRALSSGADIDLNRDEAFASLRSEPCFRELVRRSDAARSKLGGIHIAFRLADPRLVPEGIAYDPEEGTLFIGSIAERKVLAIDRRGRSRDIAGPADGLLQVLGMKVDPARRLLWVATSAGLVMDESKPYGAVIAVELPTGRVARRIYFPRDEPHFANDLTIAKDGTLYVTDSLGGGVYRLRPGSDALERVTAPGTTKFPNGVALDEPGSRLYVSSFPQGVAIVDLDSGAVSSLAHPPGVNLHGIDGLYLHEAALIAVQNWAGAPRLARFPLSSDGKAVVSCEVLARRGGRIGMPTTACIAGRKLYFVGDSLVDLLENGKLREDPRVRRPEVLSLMLKNRQIKTRKEQVF